MKPGRRSASARQSAAALVVLACLLPATAAGRSRHTAGRVVATITTLEGTVHMPGVRWSFARPAANSSSPRRMTDGAGQVTFPDVPPGRYLITASRPGFVDARFDGVRRARERDRAGASRHAADVRAAGRARCGADTPSPTDSVQPVSMSDMLSGSLFETRAARGRRFSEPAAAAARRRARRQRAPAHQGRAADPGRAADQQRQPHRSLDRRFRSRPAGAERRVGRGAGEPVRRRIRPLLDEHHADPHQTRHQRLGLLARQPGAAVPRAASGAPRLRAAAVGARSDSEGSRLPRAGLPVPLRGDAGQEPARRARDRAAKLRLVHAPRQRAVRPAHARRRPDPVSARNQTRRR